MTDLEIIDCEQGTDEWRLARLGIPTASEFGTVMGNSETRTRYMYRLAAEIISGTPVKTYSNADMDRGNAAEPAARANYAMLYNESPRTIGFIRDGRKGCSPDGLIGDDGMLELKTHKAELMVERILRGATEGEHRAQCQGNLWIARREWIDLAWYCDESKGLTMVRRRVKRDENFITRLKMAVDMFNEQLDEVVEQIKRHRG
jgi:hypothetical protein